MNMEYISCPICEISESRPFIFGGPKDIVKCKGCGLVYVNPRRSEKEIKAFFQKDYISNNQMLDTIFGTWRRETLIRIAALILKFKKSGKILDIGCAGGEFLENFLPLGGWKCYGLEPSFLAASAAIKKGISIYQGVLEDIDIPDNDFDVITYLDTLYYAPRPLEGIIKLRKILKEDGILVIEVPGYCYRLMRNVGPLGLILNGKWCSLGPPSPHLFFYSQRTLCKLLEKAGFVMIDIRLEQAPKHGSWFAHILNELHFYFSKLVFRISFQKINIAAKTAFIFRKFQS